MSTDLISDDPDRISRFFEGKVVLITGATGFLGKVLLEKLLRSCPKVKHVVTLVRYKRGKSPKQRMEEVLGSKLFDDLRKTFGPEHSKKVLAIYGDVAKKDLGICKEDKVWLHEKVQVVFHCAATMRLDECLRTAVLVNVRGTQRMLELAKGMRNLQVFQHISAAHCHKEETELLEKVYEPPADPNKIIRMCEWLRQEEIDLLAPRLMGTFPNTYAYTKALAEGLAMEQMKNLPVQILRPSVVLPIWKEPIPGWTDNLNGPAGLLVGAGKGVIRTMYLKENECADYVPVDVVANTLLFVAFLTSLKVNQRVYNITSNKEIKITYDDLMNRGREIRQNKMPIPGAVWYPDASTKPWKFYNKLCILLFHTIPAFVVDTLLYLTGFEPVMMRKQRRIARDFDVLEYYANNQLIVNNQESMELRKLMNSTEKKFFKLDMEGFNLDEYLSNCVFSIRRHILNEPEETMSALKRHLSMLWLLDKSCQIFLVYALFYLLYKQMFLRFFY